MRSNENMRRRRKRTKRTKRTKKDVPDVMGEERESKVQIGVAKMEEDKNGGEFIEKI